jgi:hypothetical protein
MRQKNSRKKNEVPIDFIDYNELKKGQMNLNTEKTNPKSQNIELGKVTWFRDYNYALHLSSKLSKPILLFFQEIPGCSTCVNFGRSTISSYNG